MTSGRKNSVVYNPDPDTHYKPHQLPSHVREPVAECIMHSAEVIRRSATRRSKKLVTTLDGNEWSIRTTPTFHLHCPHCGERKLESIYFKEDPDEIGVYCCTRCIEWREHGPSCLDKSGRDSIMQNTTNVQEASGFTVRHALTVSWDGPASRIRPLRPLNLIVGEGSRSRSPDDKHRQHHKKMQRGSCEIQ